MAPAASPALIEAVENCKLDVANNIGALYQAFQAMGDTSILPNRMAFVEVGGLDICVDVLRNFATSSSNTNDYVWAMTETCLIIDDLEDPAELQPILHFQKLGGPLYLADGLKTAESQSQSMTRIFNCASWCCQVVETIPAMVDTGCPSLAIRIIQDANHTNVDIAMSFLRSMTVLEGPTRTQIRDAGGLNCVLQYLSLFQYDDDQNLRRAFRAGSIVARLAGNDETGIGPATLRGNPLLISKTVQILDRVLDAGPKGSRTRQALFQRTEN